MNTKEREINIPTATFVNPGKSTNVRFTTVNNDHRRGSLAQEETELKNTCIKIKSEKNWKRKKKKKNIWLSYEPISIFHLKIKQPMTNYIANFSLNHKLYP